MSLRPNLKVGEHAVGAAQKVLQSVRFNGKAARMIGAEVHDDRRLAVKASGQVVPVQVQFNTSGRVQYQADRRALADHNGPGGALPQRSFNYGNPAIRYLVRGLGYGPRRSMVGRIPSPANPECCT
ncbi:hypothetical protein MARLIPOL_09194 [Marinobacter lipolyticus SM19]|uniref:Uncharacterized protein n=1 Tax=Marinobacter lipolyticus SM19 TaxID=1318628 RepID=R8B2U0_9GAMM|nr:hypothetical protein MARLIPOL_09194 [Marinobacter lipolyticus SM19]